jgi:hypothetical protein
MSNELNLKFTEDDAAFATAFIAKAGLACGNNGPVQLTTCETKDDMLDCQHFTITKVETVKEVTTIAHTFKLPCVEFVLETESRTFSWHWGEDVDVVELARAKTFGEILVEMALQEQRWHFENLLDGMSVEVPAKEEV